MRTLRPSMLVQLLRKTLRKLRTRHLRVRMQACELDVAQLKFFVRSFETTFRPLLDWLKIGINASVVIGYVLFAREMPPGWPSVVYTVHTVLVPVSVIHLVLLLRHMHRNGELGSNTSAEQGRTATTREVMD